MLSRITHDRGFLIHFAAYVLVNAFLIYLNLSATPPQTWFVWPLAGWGIGVLAHAACVGTGRSESGPRGA